MLQLINVELLFDLLNVVNNVVSVVMGISAAHAFIRPFPIRDTTRYYYIAKKDDEDFRKEVLEEPSTDPWFRVYKRVLTQEDDLLEVRVKMIKEHLMVRETARAARDVLLLCLATLLIYIVYTALIFYLFRYNLSYVEEIEILAESTELVGFLVVTYMVKLLRENRYYSLGSYLLASISGSGSQQ